MRSKTLLSLMCGLAALASAGCVTFTEMPPKTQPASAGVVRIVADDAYALNAQGDPGTAAPPQFDWQKELREQPAARSLIFSSFHGPASALDYSDFYNDYVLY